jgi:hypothetical protein
VALVRTDVSEEPGASFIRVTKIGELGTTQAATSNRRTLRSNTKLRCSLLSLECPILPCRIFGQSCKNTSVILHNNGDNDEEDKECDNGISK